MAYLGGTSRTRHNSSTTVSISGAFYAARYRRTSVSVLLFMGCAYVGKSSW